MMVRFFIISPQQVILGEKDDSQQNNGQQPRILDTPHQREFNAPGEAMLDP
jgi:hypothetical protein